jgi:hypothetical protein
VALEVAGDVARVPDSPASTSRPTPSARPARVGETGATFVDGGIIGPPPGDGRTARLHLAGPAEATARVAALADVGSLPSVAARAWRWAPELREIAATLEDAGLPPETAAATAETLSRWADLKDAWDVPLAEVLDHLRR